MLLSSFHAKHRIQPIVSFNMFFRYPKHAARCIPIFNRFIRIFVASSTSFSSKIASKQLIHIEKCVVDLFYYFRYNSRLPVMTVCLVQLNDRWYRYVTQVSVTFIFILANIWSIQLLLSSTLFWSNLKTRQHTREYRKRNSIASFKKNKLKILIQGLHSIC